MDSLTTREIINTDEICRELGTSVKHLRQVQGITQEELAYRAGLHRTYIGCVERGEKNVGVATIFKVAHGLGIEPWELFKEIEIH